MHGLIINLLMLLFEGRRTGEAGVPWETMDEGVSPIAQNAYCSRNIYFQFNKVCRSFNITL